MKKTIVLELVLRDGQIDATIQFKKGNSTEDEIKIPNCTATQIDFYVKRAIQSFVQEAVDELITGTDPS